MILLIDIGNSRTKYVQCIDGQLSDIVQLANEDFNKVYFAQSFVQATAIIVANVANAALTDALALWCKSNKIDFLQVYSEQKKFQLTSAYQEPSSLGIDRWLALLATTHLYPKSCVLIIDAGTATTIDLVDQSGQHQGGWILAGIKALFNSILSHSTLVHANREVDCQTLPSVGFGCNTSDNVNNACWAATLGLIEQGIVQAEKLASIDKILLTGGNGELLAKLLTEQVNHASREKRNIEFVEKLIFYGLREYIRQ